MLLAINIIPVYAVVMLFGVLVIKQLAGNVLTPRIICDPIGLHPIAKYLFARLYVNDAVDDLRVSK